MEIEDNELGGKSILLGEGDRLDQVPRSHRRLLTPSIIEAFADPVAYFRRLTSECPFEEMAKWFNAVLEDPYWELELHRGVPALTAAGFCWYSESVTPVTVSLPGKPKASYPKALRDYYSIVGEISWGGFGCAGGIQGSGGDIPLSSWGVNATLIDPKTSFLWGVSGCGDMLFWTTDNQAGWLCHGSGRIHLIGTVADTINWVFQRLNSERVPELDLGMR